MGRYFLNISKKNTQDLGKFNGLVEKFFFKGGVKSNSSNFLFLKNSDHSDMNRWLKRGWGLLEPISLIKLPKILDTNDLDLLRFRFNEKNNTVLGKNTNNIYLAFKQKRYAIRKKF